MKRFLTVAFAAALVFGTLFSSCKGNGGEVSAESSEQSEEVEPVIYTIVYFRTYADEADYIAEKVKAASGLEFPVVKYTAGYAVPKNSIVIGIISDGVSENLTEGMNKRDFAVKTAGNNIYICGSSRSAVTEGAVYFAENLVTTRGVGAELIDGFEYYYDHPYPLEGAAINGVTLCDFDIIYAPTENEAKYGDVAVWLKDYLDAYADAAVSAYPKDRVRGENELIIGIVPGRELVGGYYEKDFDYNAYKIIVSGTNAAVIGNNACAVYNGVAALMDYIASSDGKNAADTVIDGTCDLVKVACVGDSITKGANSTYPNIQNYPAYLQQMLGYNYYVKNFGIDGYSLIDTDYYAYKKTAEYNASKAFKPDVVLFMLGTNDCNPGQDYKDWTNPEREVKYKESAGLFFDAYRAANENVQIFMGVPSTLFYSTVWPWEEWAARIVAHAVPLNREIAEENDLPVIDIYTWSLENPSVFTDGLHPRDETYKLYAKRVYDEIIGVILKPENIINH